MPSLMPPWGIFLLSAGLSLLLTGIIRRYALTRNLLDVPNSRSSHQVPTPRGGGLAIVATFFAGLLFLWLIGSLPPQVLLALTGAGGLVAWIGLLDDRSLQVLLREVQSDDLLDFLWYMKDGEIAKRVFANLSQRAAEMLFDDLELRYGHLNPDTVPQVYIDKARAALLRILESFDQLQAEGQILQL